MRILVAGASGAIGAPLGHQLIDAGARGNRHARALRRALGAGAPALATPPAGGGEGGDGHRSHDPAERRHGCRPYRPGSERPPSTRAFRKTVGDGG